MTVLIMAKTSPPKKAASQLSTSKPGSSPEAIFSATALAKRPSPKVAKKPNGRPRSRTSGRMRRLTMPSTSAAATATGARCAASSPPRLMPGKIVAVATSEITSTTQTTTKRKAKRLS
jgi:hypothetical protein